jgi:hypothetical protein
MSTMQVCIHYERQNYDVTLRSSNPTVQNLMTEISHRLGVVPARQSLIFKGRRLDKKKDKLTAHGIHNSSKILLFSVSEAKDDEPAKRRPPRDRNFSTELDREPHSTIIAQRPPPGCLPGMKAPSNLFPKEPFCVYDTTGARAKLSIESDAFWVESATGECERIFFSDVQSPPLFVWLPDYDDQYMAMFFPTINGKRVFYFRLLGSESEQVRHSRVDHY